MQRLFSSRKKKATRLRGQEKGEREIETETEETETKVLRSWLFSC